MILATTCTTGDAGVGNKPHDDLFLPPSIAAAYDNYRGGSDPASGCYRSFLVLAGRSSVMFFSTILVYDTRRLCVRALRECSTLLAKPSAARMTPSAAMVLTTVRRL